MVNWSALNRVRNSLYERARHFYAKERRRRLAIELGMSASNDASFEVMQTIASLRAMISFRPSTLIDVGCHVGEFATVADACFNFHNIICIEADAELLTAARNHLSGKKNVDYYNIAISAESGQEEFFFHSDKSMSSLVPADPVILKNAWKFDDPKKIVKRMVRTSRLDEIVTTQQIEMCDHILLKIDTQGNELRVLEGAERILWKVSACVVEYMFTSPYRSDFVFEDIIQFCGSRGLCCCGPLSIQRRESGAVSAVDFLFVSNRHASVSRLGERKG